MIKRVAVIGAGASGLAATKACLEEGLEPVTFERSDSIGGLWHFTEDVDEEKGCVMRSTVMNTSKEFTSFSDFLFPDEFPNLMHNRYVYEYLKRYSDHFNLTSYIQYNTEVIFITKSADYNATGQWKVSYRVCSEGADPQEISDIFDGVMMCTGHLASKLVPTFTGQQYFKGPIVHTRDYKGHKGMENKRVVVIGAGNSGLDVAVELSRIAKQVYLVTRSGFWLHKKCVRGNMPWDIVKMRRVNMAISRLLGPALSAKLQENEYNAIIDHKRYGIQPKYGINRNAPVGCDELPSAMLCGLVKVKPGVAKVGMDTVAFVDGTEVEADVIILATGYVFAFNCLDKEVAEAIENQVNLYKFMFPPALTNGTLSIIGCVQPSGSLFPIFEMQSRWAVRVIKGICKLPESANMWRDIRNTQNAIRQQYVNKIRCSIKVDWIPYLDEIAELIDCKPNIGKMFCSDPCLAYHVFFGPCTPVQYRLTGPHAWEGAREAILTTMNRVYKPMESRKTEEIIPEGFTITTRITCALFTVIIAIIVLI